MLGFNEAAADTAENVFIETKMNKRVTDASMRPRPIPRKTRREPLEARDAPRRFNEAAADTAENVTVSERRVSSPTALQ